jgi:hypothetical protein
MGSVDSCAAHKAYKFSAVRDSVIDELEMTSSCRVIHRLGQELGVSAYHGQQVPQLVLDLGRRGRCSLRRGPGAWRHGIDDAVSALRLTYIML